MLSKVKSVQPVAPQTANGWGSIFSPSFKDHCRKAVAGGLYHSGVLWATQGFEGSHEFIATADTRLPRLRRSFGSKFGILCYHRVGTEGVPFCSRLEPALFEAQMRYLRKRYRLVPLGQLCRELCGGDQVPPTLAITFDDGYRDLYIYALPVLQKYETEGSPYYSTARPMYGNRQCALVRQNFRQHRCYTRHLARARDKWLASVFSHHSSPPVRCRMGSRLLSSFDI